MESDLLTARLGGTDLGVDVEAGARIAGIKFGTPTVMSDSTVTVDAQVASRFYARVALELGRWSCHGRLVYQRQRDMRINQSASYE